jgi:NAD(P)-dependent dehydrogenase (short-subunit alcohol dehydrogenase family)
MSQKVAVVTGGGSGIGRAVAQGLDKEGYLVVICGRRLQELLKTAEGTNITSVSCDVSMPGPVSSLFSTVREQFGRLDLLFNNAGSGTPPIPLEDLSFEQWNTVVGVNLTGSFLCAQEAIRIMKSQTPQGGRIINNGSISAHAPRPRSVAYTATKHAITGLTKSISLDGRPHDIVCGQIDIGNAVSPLTERMVAGVLQPDGSTRAEPRLEIQHVVNAVLYMASLPLDANVQFMTVMASKMPFVGRG